MVAGMPLSLAFNEPDTFVVQATGSVTYPDVRLALDEMEAHSAYSGTLRILVDGRGVTRAPSAGELRQIAREMGPLAARGRVSMAIVADKAFVYGVARMFGVFAELFGVSVRAFHTPDEAGEWLRTQPDPAAGTNGDR